MRINKFLSLCEVGSRRKVEELVIKGHVTVNGKVVTNLSTQIDVEHDTVLVNGNKVEPVTENVYIMLNKPKGYITSTSDERNRPVVTKLINGLNVKVYPVGRLDYNTEGLLLLTNDGQFANSVIHPKNNIEKEYLVQFSGKLTQSKIEALSKKFIIDGYKTTPAIISNLFKINQDVFSLNIVIFEGRNRQIRKMFEQLDLKIINLKRIRIGGLKLNNLPTGSYKLLSKNEINKIYNK